jgi:hypothetical protein
MQGCGRGDLRKKHHLEDLEVGGRTMLKLILKEVGWGDMDWIDLVRIETGGVHL